MNLLTRYLAREIYAGIALVFAALILLFAFLDLIYELNSLGQGNYGLGYVLLYVLLTVPGHIYELFPVAVLIGSILALVQMAAHSELTIYRCSGASLGQMVRALLVISLPLVLLSFLCGEFVSPPSERMAQSLRLKASNAQLQLKEFRSGVWAKDEHSFVNVKNVLPDSSLLNVNIYEFDEDRHVRTMTVAKRATFIRAGRWRLEQVAQTVFDGHGATARTLPEMEWQSSLGPGILNVLLVVPEQMSAWSLRQYINHLEDNHQKTARYEVAFWNKLAYPLSLPVMLLLALPFAAVQHRSGGVSGKIFAGIVLGLTFHFVGKLFGNLGAINDWPAMLSVAVMPILFLVLGSTMLWWTERR